MATQPISRKPVDLAPPPFLARVLAVILGGAALFLLAAVAFSLIFSLVYLGRVLPGVSVAGVDLGGVRRTEAAALIASQISYPQQGSIELVYGDMSWDYTPAELGLELDSQASADAAYSYGRGGWPWVAFSEKLQSLQGGEDLAPRLVFNGQVAHLALQQIANQINQPTREAEMSVNGLEVQVQPGQIGRSLDSEKTATFLAAQMLRLQSGPVPLVVIEDPPAILDVSAQAAIAEEILSQPLRILPGGNYDNNPDPWVLQPEELAEMLSIERVDALDGAYYQMGLQTQALGTLLVSLAPQVRAEPDNPRFIFNDETREFNIIKAETIGRTLEVQESIEHINAQLAQGAHEIELQYDYSAPEITGDANAAEMDITELVSERTTYFYGSSPERIQNIQTAAARFHGLLVAPGEVFSMVENIGDISLESGFAEALIIYGDRTIKGVGGGVCQVSTTLFRAVFFGGYPVIERNPHAYRVYYYELNAAGGINGQFAGLDATVYAPIVDFKFQNDSDNWLLMETYVDPGARTLTWKFYSTSDGRSVEWDTTGPRNTIDPPDPIYEENEELAKGEVKQVDWAAEGADVSVTRTVYRNGSVYFEDTFTTHYRPWADIYQYGPDTPGYPPEEKKPQNN